MIKQALLKNWDLGHWYLFVIWYLVFGAYSRYEQAQQTIASHKKQYNLLRLFCLPFS
jgi:hypothetical protein